MDQRLSGSEHVGTGDGGEEDESLGVTGYVGSERTRITDSASTGLNSAETWVIAYCNGRHRWRLTQPVNSHMANSAASMG